MKAKSLVVLLLAALFMMNFSGCIGVNGNFKRVRDNILVNIDGRADRVVEFALGPSGMMFASLITSFAADEEYVDDLMRQVTKIQVGVYERKDFSEPNYMMLKDLSDEMNDQGWNYLVRSYDHGNLAAVFTQSDDLDNIHSLFIVVLERDEMVMVELKGNLDRMIEIAVRENGLKFDIAGNY
ncbi:MAG: DUF4252 domain-containing protein [Melioribacteraceae bacterium]|nr:DUF4252 domain-containing protein [Melioribacteraceae bacterium]MDD3558519.1 DUF4252 domain-containing protein [Melioribacteraceae bacterium]